MTVLKIIKSKTCKIVIKLDLESIYNSKNLLKK